MVSRKLPAQNSPARNLLGVMYPLDTLPVPYVPHLLSLNESSLIACTRYLSRTGRLTLMLPFRTVQEFVLARQVFLMCGHLSLEGTNMAESFTRIYHHAATCCLAWGAANGDLGYAFLPVSVVLDIKVTELITHLYF